MMSSRGWSAKWPGETEHFQFPFLYIKCSLTSLEDLSLPEFAICRMERLLGTVIPTRGDTRFALLRGFIAHPALENLRDDRAVRVVRVRKVQPVGEAYRPPLVVHLIDKMSVF